MLPCLACNVDGATDLSVVSHPVESCSISRSLPQKEKESKVKCLKHPSRTDPNTAGCTVKGRACKKYQKDTHPFLLCPTKKARTDSNVAKNQPASSFAGKLMKSPVLLQAQFVTSIHDCRIGMLLDLGSTNNYVTHKFAKKNKLQSEDIDVEIEGITGDKLLDSTKIYTAPIIYGG